MLWNQGTLVLCYHTKSSAGQFLYTDQVIYPAPLFPLLFLQWKPLWSSRNASAAGEWLMRDCSEQQCSALMPIVKNTGLSSTHLCWEPCGHSCFFHSENSTHKSQSLSFTRPIFLMYTSPFILKGVLLEFSSVLCTSKDQFKCYCDKLLANTCISEVTGTSIAILFPIQMSICGLCLVSQHPAAGVSCVCYKGC